MKSRDLKNLIKEAVREAVKEEISEILKEAVKEASQPDNIQSVITQDQSAVKEEKKKAVKTTFSNSPISEMLNMTAQSMTKEDYNGVMGGQPTAPSMASSMASNMGMTGNGAGIDISKLDFMKNAGKIYKESVKKDKTRRL